MHIKSFRVENFRRLKNVRVDLDKKTTIFVGANNSGKTSATHVFQRFLDPKVRFQIYDFTADCWDVFNSFDPAEGNAETDLPKIYFDLWFEVDDENMHRVVDLLPGLDWNGEPVGLRMVYAPRDPSTLMANYLKSRNDRRLPVTIPAGAYQPWPLNLTDYLTKRLTNEYEIKYFVLDARKCDTQLMPEVGYDPFYLGTNASGAGALVSALLKVDFLNAQRHLTDAESHGRAEDLSRRLSRYYQRNLQKFETDLDALSAIANSESALNEHFAQAFDSILKSIEHLGYPGANNAGLVVKASFNVQNMLSTSARVHYMLPTANGTIPSDASQVLPDQYNGLGFKNLIYMAVEILDFHHAWEETEGQRPPVHLIMIEEPEAHLHAQLQQVFIRRVFELLPEPKPGFHTQMVVTTHSSHILYESSFQPIRYFCRDRSGQAVHRSEVKNLSIFYNGEQKATRDFLQQYLKLTHCDLFFADAAVLVEGNVERLLLPLIIERKFPALKACHLTILEVGGAFAHKFQELLEFLDITTLAITDLDSSEPKEQQGSEKNDSNGGHACRTTVPRAVTSNETLAHWFPKLTTIEELLDLPDSEKVVQCDGGGSGNIRVTYQTRRLAAWGADAIELAGRTLEEAFALENLAWTQDPSKKSIGLSIPKSSQMTLDELHDALFKRVRNLDKTRFALGLIAEQDTAWRPPQYIMDGLEWLREHLLPQSLQASTEGKDKE
ncbi:ATP-dependent endonuclease [Streptomyces sp. NPDC048215]|uniref:ATP-dependent nuclease n=1 Tax=Streptomyces TaxID=1883 RepID=UPI00136E149A|nr:MULTISPECIES: ATP-dependent endonuclease [Streptomyces]MYT56500.1 AAA family ATPase [Streptomyces sp. SID7834]WSK28323.1 ATP-dependent endonuclease [[Kitasatospora] papulosa]WSS71155.1 ATP-dependent endonuclease [Streptomyces sp. NBC_01175]